MKNKFTDFPLLESKKKTYPLFYPYISKYSKNSIKNVLQSRWIGQGPLVDEFEEKFKYKFNRNLDCVAVGSGTDALHLSYILSGIKKNDEVICPVFTCTATNIPLLYIGAKIKFVDIDPITLNIDINHLKKIVTKKTKAIVFVNYGGIPCDLKELNEIKKKYKLKLIQDAAQSLGSKFNNKDISNFADFTIYSFQAIKHITSGDGGLLVFNKNKKILSLAQRIRWFGIDRIKKQGGTWENDIKEIGYKYQMTDLGARLLLDSLKDFNKILFHRKKIFEIYKKNLSKINGLKVLDTKDKKLSNSFWLCTILTKKRIYLQKELRKHNIESNQVHFRNDRYKIFKNFITNRKFPNMDKIQNHYLVIPLNHKISVNDAKFISKKIIEILKRS
jgi:perosamine synthetase